VANSRGRPLGSDRALNGGTAGVFSCQGIVRQSATKKRRGVRRHRRVAGNNAADVTVQDPREVQERATYLGTSDLGRETCERSLTMPARID
jgi:hypothetical protein